MSPQTLAIANHQYQTPAVTYVGPRFAAIGFGQASRPVDPIDTWEDDGGAV